MRAVIMCAGRGSRWNGHLGVSKHHVEVDGERIVDRTVRLLRARGISDVWTTSDVDDAIVRGVPNLVCGTPPVTTGTELDRFYNAVTLWVDCPEDGFCYLYGDTYYTESCVALIVNARGDFRAVGRSGPSQRTKKPYEEIFGIKVTDFDMAYDALERVYLAYRRWKFADYVDRPKRDPWVQRTSGWEWYRAVEGFPLREPLFGPRFIECDDWTEDFDWPGDYERWLQQWSASKLACGDGDVLESCGNDCGSDLASPVPGKRPA